MSVTESMIAGRALPQPDNTSRRYWTEAAQGNLLIQRCPSCQSYQFYPRPLCLQCGDEPDWVPASGRGTLHTYTIIRQNKTPPFAALVPYAVAIVELDEGVRMMTNLIDCDVDQLSIGMPVEVVLAPVNESIGLPFWRPASTSR
jgi:uncharacterized OB-fold protein